MGPFRVSAHTHEVIFDGDRLAIPPIGCELPTLRDTVVDADDALGQRTWLTSEPVVSDKDGLSWGRVRARLWEKIQLCQLSGRKLGASELKSLRYCKV